MLAPVALTLFDFAGKVGRMREAQTKYEDIQSLQSQQIKIALENEVDSILARIAGTTCTEELRRFAAYVALMRKAQKLERMATSAQMAVDVARTELAVDNILARAARDAVLLNKLTMEQNQGTLAKKGAKTG